MKDLRLKLDDTDFDQLVELGRSVIPTVAPRWTDHNVHDPGMMLLDLVSWIADAQIYSLARPRRDERRAYARLLGVDAHGPRPARGLLWPSLGDAGPRWPVGMRLEKGTPATAEYPDAPEFFTTHEITLTGARLIGLRTVLADGTTHDLAVSNEQEGATFLPFGPAPAPGDRFVLRVSGSLIGEAAASGLVAVGVEVAPPVGPQPNAPRESDGRRRARASLRLAIADSRGERPLALEADTTQGLARSGVILVRVTAAMIPSDPQFRIVVRSADGEFPRPPRLRKIALDVLPVEQRQDLPRIDQQLGLGDMAGTGLPDQVIDLGGLTLVHPADGGVLEVDVFEGAEWRKWMPVPDLARVGPDARAYSLDLAQGVITFGNGVNGAVPPLQAPLRVGCSLTSGPAGNLPAGLPWTVSAVGGVFGTNTEPTWGGSDGADLDELHSLARLRTREARPIVTLADLQSAALELTELGVNRAIELAAGEGCRRVRGTRILVVLRGDRPDPGSERTAETPRWLAAIRGQLAPRLPLGQKLEVVAARLVPVRIQATLVARPNVDPDTVMKAARTALRQRLRILSEHAGDTPWPFGRDVSGVAVKGWLRNVDGVARVASVSLLEDGEPKTHIEIGPGALPEFEDREGDVAVERAPMGATA